MKKIVLIFAIIFMSFSCKKDSFVPDNEIPDWLRTKIRQDEQTTKEFPKYMTAYGAWLRYKWKTEYYFEYHNIVSSSLPIPVSVKGDSLPFHAGDTDFDYYKEKCCGLYVWKAPKYKEY